MSSPWDDRQHRVPTTHHMANMPVLPPISDSHFAPMSMRGQQASSMRPPMQLQQYPSGPGDLPPHSMRVPVHPPIRSQVPPPPVGGHSVSSYDRVVMPAPELETLIKSNVSDSNDVPTAFNLLSRFGVTTLNELEGMLRDLEKIRRSLPSEEEGRVLTLIAETYMVPEPSDPPSQCTSFLCRTRSFRLRTLRRRHRTIAMRSRRFNVAPRTDLVSTRHLVARTTSSPTAADTTTAGTTTADTTAADTTTAGTTTADTTAAATTDTASRRVTPVAVIIRADAGRFHAESAALLSTR
ncbi:MAG: hypothetical protein MHM6MM_008072 [Cercozoa sp. M6MM]